MGMSFYHIQKSVFSFASRHNSFDLEEQSWLSVPVSPLWALVLSVGDKGSPERQSQLVTDVLLFGSFERNWASQLYP